MRKSIVILSLVCILSLSRMGRASDDVYVDLSVLNVIPQDSIGFVESKPVFPIIEKEHVLKRKTVRDKIKPIKPEPRKPQLPATEAEDQSIEKETPILEIFAPEISSEENQKQQDSVSETEPKVSTKEKQVSAETEETTFITPLESKKPQTLLSAKISENKIEDNSKESFVPREIYSLAFAPDSAELSEETLRRLEHIAGRFAENNEKKLSIKAYNYDNGQDSFRKKRVSLNRATEVRSYFLSKGFRNFSIKIINTTTDNEYKDTVEIETMN